MDTSETVTAVRAATEALEATAALVDASKEPVSPADRGEVREAVDLLDAAADRLRERVAHKLT